MTARTVHLLIAVLVLVAACQSGSGPKCELFGGTQLAPPEVIHRVARPTPQDTPAVLSTWPKFRADAANSGRTTIDLTGSRGQEAFLLFDGYCQGAGKVTLELCRVGDLDACPTPSGSPNPTPTAAASATTSPAPTTNPCTCIGATSTNPGESDGDAETSTPRPSTEHIRLASADAGPSPTPPPVPIQVQAPIIGSPLLGADGTIFVPSNTLLTQFNPDGTTKNAGNLVGFPAASPNISGRRRHDLHRHPGGQPRRRVPERHLALRVAGAADAGYRDRRAGSAIPNSTTQSSSSPATTARCAPTISTATRIGRSSPPPPSMHPYSSIWFRGGSPRGTLMIHR